MTDADDSLPTAVKDAMTRPEVVAAVERIHAEIEKEVREIGPACQMSGRCCRFEEYGHRLFITTAELAAFARRLREHPELGSLAAAADGNGCRFQSNGMCIAHLIRPMGCRLFFCDDRTQSRMHALYEEMHRKMKDLHGQHGVSYRYVEWRQGLIAIGEMLVTRPADCPKP